MRYFVELSYNGKAYHGWQNQPNAVTVQEVLEHAFSTLMGKTVNLVGAGRTDTGVHALQMIAHFDWGEIINIEDLIYKLNSFLPNDIVIHDIFRVKDECHARFDAISRTYKYRISTSKNAFTVDEAYCFKTRLDLDKMNTGSKVLLNHKDFQCFSRTKSDVKTYTCHIKQADWRKQDDELVFTIRADRFLRNMVRAIVGTLIEVGLGKMSIEGLENVIKSKDRSQAGASVPAHGLYLVQVEYPKSIKLK
ncbi:MAG: tRNA pseudouridine(38-40) synthase TruA [Flavobacteriaceae bacterium]|nr:tRNA pseudouridine(38-40) synthase TruA [Bacteroidia bacterium]NNK87692.1 tRNA pseudouridine(38-40) synthase TruA [Flavobacteriaceae bacterium]